MATNVGQQIKRGRVESGGVEDASGVPLPPAQKGRWLASEADGEGREKPPDDDARAPGSSSASSSRPMTMREARFQGRSMPADFNAQLGRYGDPDEAKDLEDLTGGYDDFDDLPPARREALKQSVRHLSHKIEAGTVEGVCGLPAGQLEHLRVKASRLFGFKDTARKSELIAAYRELVREGAIAESAALEELLIRKRGKSHSGVLVITVFMGPGEFSCPKDCHYCPNQPGVARSYLLKEPAVLRGFRNGWDPIQQFYDRASALERNGHVVDKIELIILGGTFSFYPAPYVEGFLAASYYAASTYYEVFPLRPLEGLAEEIARNESARCRIIGVTIETRPDYIRPAELRRFRALGVTRVQLGIQHLDDRILEGINRDCPTAKTVRAIRGLLDAGFKVDAHWMPDLPGSSFAADLEMFETLFSPENESFQVDQWKVYPTATVPYTKISEWYREGRYKPYAELDGGDYMVRLLVYIMANCPHRIRLNRIIRDIPTTYIMGGEKRCNLRQVIEAKMRAERIVCKDIRARECKGNPLVDRARTRLFVDEFRASAGLEFYLSIENDTRTQLYGHLRLRLRADPADPARSIFPALLGCALIRELHTYGKLVAVDGRNAGNATQHVGVGAELMKRAEAIARARGFRRIAVIAGVGARRYYAKLGYALQETYMIKSLDDADAAITEAQVIADNDNDQEPVGLLGAIKKLFFPQQ